MSSDILVENEADLENVAIAAVHAEGCDPGPASPALAAELDAAIARAQARPDAEAVTAPVRDLLRHGRYKPTGRGKPASEYLLGAARAGTFPRVSALVDINNLVSLEALLPISLLDVERVGSRRFLVRRGRGGEAYVFNASGQSIELQDLLLVAAMPEDRPLANPVKDSMASKVIVEPGDDRRREVLAVIYAPARLAGLAREAAERFAALLRAHAGPSGVRIC